MISRGATGTHVCWRCQLHLSKSLTANSASSTRLPGLEGVRLLHNDAWPESAETSSALAPSPDGSRNKHDESIPRAPTKIKQTRDFKRPGAWHPLRKKALTEYPLGRLHGFRGHRLREKRAQLNVDSLGTPAEVIVLRDAGFNSRPLPDIEELKVAEKVDILKQLDAERGLITQADVEKNIEDCRPEEKTISWTEFQHVQRQLVSGFTTSQLIKYLDAPRHRQKKVEEGCEVGTREGSRGTIIGKSQWMAQVSETGDKFEENSLRGYDSEAFTPKQRLALLLMRQCWQMEALEVIESIGEVELEIASSDLELLIGKWELDI
jgi:hypothetical protein